MSEKSNAYHAFISYSHGHDQEIAEALQKRIQTFGRSWYLTRGLRVFRDTTNLSASPKLWADIERALGESTWFILMASPHAAKSRWVRQEIDWWLSNKSTDNMLIALTGGDIDWDHDLNDFDWSRTTALPHKELAARLPGMPRWVDLRPCSGELPDEIIAEFSAPIRGMSKDDLVGEHLKQRRLFRWALAATCAALLVLIVVIVQMAVAYANERRVSQERQENVVARRLVGESEAAAQKDPELSRLFALEGNELSPGDAEVRRVVKSLTLLPPIGMLRGIDADIYTLAVSPDGKTLAVGDVDGTIQLWDAIKKQPAGAHLKTDGSIQKLAFSRDGRLFATASMTGSIRLWDAPTRQLLGHLDAGDLQEGERGVKNLVFTPDGNEIIALGRDGVVRVWSLAVKRLVATLSTGEAYSNGLAISNDGRFLATADEYGTMHIWDLPSKRVIHKMQGHQGTVSSMAFSPSGDILATGSFDKTVRLWSVRSGQSMGAPLKHTETVVAVAFASNGKTVASAGLDNVVRLWDVTTHKASGPPLQGHAGNIYAIAFFPDGRTLAGAGQEGVVRLWDTAVSRPSLIVEESTEQISARFSPDGKLIAVGDRDGRIRLRDSASGKVLHLLDGHRRSVMNLTFRADGKLLASAGGDGTVRLWDVATGKSMGDPIPAGACPPDGTVTGNQCRAAAVVFSQDGGLLVTGSFQGSIRKWNVATREPVGDPIPVGDGPIARVEFGNDGRTLVVASESGTVYLLDADDVSVRNATFHHGAQLTDLAVSSRGNVLATAGMNGSVRFWSMSSGASLGRPLSAPGPVTSIGFSPDGTTLATASHGADDKGFITLWDVATRKPIGDALRGHDWYIYSVEFDAEGKRLVTAGADNVAMVWDVSTLPQDPVSVLCPLAQSSVAGEELAGHMDGIPYRVPC